MKIHKKGNWEYWYDPSLKCWYAMKTDPEGKQIGDSINAFDKEGILYAISLEDPAPRTGPDRYPKYPAIPLRKNFN